MKSSPCGWLGSAMFLFFCVMLFFCSASVLAVENSSVTPQHEENEIVVEGDARPRRSMNRGGSSDIIRPASESSFDINQHFRLDPSLTGYDAGRAGQGGFSIPLFRGHDVRSSHVFLDDIELQDPYTGFPLVEDVDLHSFGELRIHKGLAPWDVPVVGSGGVLQFVTRKIHQDQSHLGMRVSDNRDAAAWLGRELYRDKWSLLARGQRTTGPGNYEYYDDGGTIRNQDDDEMIQSKHNEHQGLALSGLGHYEVEDWRFEAFSWNNSREYGLAVKGFDPIDEAPRIRSETSLLYVSSSRSVSTNGEIRLFASRLHASRQYTDPSQLVSRSQARTFETSNSSVGLNLGWQWPSSIVLVKPTFSSVEVESGDSIEGDITTTNASSQSVYAGFRHDLTSWLQTELKADRRWTSISGNGTSIGSGVFARLGLFHLWVQAIRHSRLPSLLERSGNAAEILASQDLEAEQGQYGEIGLRHTHQGMARWSGERAITAWGDDIRQRLEIRPISATQWRALNHKEHRLRGVDYRESWSAKRFEMELAASRIDARNHEGRYLPKIPVWQAAVSPAVDVAASWKVKVLSRLTGVSYLDDQNTTELDSHWTHDLSVDRNAKSDSIKMAFVLSNITDVTSVRVKDLVTGQEDGRMARESYTGHPLPGRHWSLSVSTQL